MVDIPVSSSRFTSWEFMRREGEVLIQRLQTVYGLGLRVSIDSVLRAFPAEGAEGAPCLQFNPSCRGISCDGLGLP